MKIGVIGDGVHSKRIQKILIKKKLNFYIYKPNKPYYFNKEKFSILKKCNSLNVKTLELLDKIRPIIVVPLLLDPTIKII